MDAWQSDYSITQGLDGTSTASAPVRPFAQFATNATPFLIPKVDSKLSKNQCNDSKLESARETIQSPVQASQVVEQPGTSGTATGSALSNWEQANQSAGASQASSHQPNNFAGATLQDSQQSTKSAGARYCCNQRQPIHDPPVNRECARAPIQASKSLGQPGSSGTAARAASTNSRRPMKCAGASSLNESNEDTRSVMIFCPDCLPVNHPPNRFLVYFPMGQEVGQYHHVASVSRNAANTELRVVASDTRNISEGWVYPPLPQPWLDEVLGAQEMHANPRRQACNCTHSDPTAPRPAKRNKRNDS